MSRGRPRKNVDAKRVIYLASIGHTFKETAALENISDDTLRRNFAAAREKGKTLCDAQIKRKQVEKALAGNGGPVSERTVDVQVNRLRRKIEHDPGNPLIVQTVRGIGYRLVPAT